MTGAPEPGNLAERLRPVVTALTLMLRRETGQLPLSATQATVLALLDREGATRVSALAAATHVTQPSMTMLLNRMERAGWVRRGTDRTDQRVVNVVLTATGRRMLDKAAAARTAVLAERLKALTPAQRRAISAALPALSLLTEVEDPR